MILTEINGNGNYFFFQSEFTPLHLAAKNGHLRTVRCLILAGADPSITSRVSCLTE